MAPVGMRCMWVRLCGSRMESSNSGLNTFSFYAISRTVVFLTSASCAMVMARS